MLESQRHSPLRATVQGKAGIAILRGNLAPDGAVIKVSTASPQLFEHRGRAVVFESIEDFHARINDEALDIDDNSVMVLKNCGPRGYPGMAEVGNMPLPPKVLRQGVHDMVRISDARMRGTAYGTVVLHASPEAAAGGPLALVESGDTVTLDVGQRILRLEADDATLAARRTKWTPPPLPERGWERLYVEHVLQAHQGADLDFLVGCSGAPMSAVTPIERSRSGNSAVKAWGFRLRCEHPRALRKTNMGSLHHHGCTRR